MYQALQDNMVKLRARAKETLESAYADMEVCVLEGGYASFDEFENARKSVRQCALDEKVCVCVCVCVCVLYKYACVLDDKFEKAKK